MAVPSLRGNIARSLFGNAWYAACQWGLLVILARLGSAEDVGRFAWALAVAAPVMTLLSFQTRTLQATDAAGEFRTSDYFGLRLISSATGWLIVIAAGLLGDPLLFVILGAAKFVESVSDSCYGLYERHEKLGWQARSLFLRGTLMLIAFWSGMAWTGRVEVAVGGMAGAWLIALLLHDLPTARKLIRGTDARLFAIPTAKLKQLAFLGIPAAIGSLMTALETSLPRAAVRQFLGEAELGIFAAAAYTLFAARLVVRAASQAALPRLAQIHMRAETPRFRRLLIRITLLCCGLGAMTVLGVIVGGRWFLEFCYGSEYGNAAGLLIWLAIAEAVRFSAMPFALALRAQRSYRQLAVVQGAGVVALVVCLLLFVPELGAAGAAIATGTSAVVMGIGWMRLIAKSQRDTQPMSPAVSLKGSV